MEYAYATCILNETGEEINETNLTAVLEAAGSDVQTSRVKAIVAALEDIDIGDVTDVDAATLRDDASGADGNGTPADEEELDEPESDSSEVDIVDEDEPAEADYLQELGLEDDAEGVDKPTGTHDAEFEEDDQFGTFDGEE